MRGKARWVALVAATTLAASASVLTPSVAAFESYYYCNLYPSGWWCDGTPTGTYTGLHSWDWNEAWYPGTWDGSVTACQRVYRPATGGVLAGSSCKVNRTYAYYGNVTCICYEAQAKQISGGSHTIWGYADAAY